MLESLRLTLIIPELEAQQTVLGFFVSCPLPLKDFHLKPKDLEDYTKPSGIHVANEVANEVAAVPWASEVLVEYEQQICHALTDWTIISAWDYEVMAVVPMLSVCPELVSLALPRMVHLFNIDQAATPIFCHSPKIRRLKQ
ncbi:hypothetical protein KI688_007206 [Linnemannia hyalina]|uniref:Uncharacterized protein n=1 Tax=Linnemannia hyalina TaxID=64524 RepID=A0A9P7XHX0_9FUNG|nr:hypothetical protein KI688_007206 [Linnemannia hyalina]